MGGLLAGGSPKEHKAYIHTCKVTAETCLPFVTNAAKRSSIALRQKDRRTKARLVLMLRCMERLTGWSTPLCLLLSECTIASALISRGAVCRLFHTQSHNGRLWETSRWNGSRRDFMAHCETARYIDTEHCDTVAASSADIQRLSRPLLSPSLPSVPPTVTPVRSGSD